MFRVDHCGVGAKRHAHRIGCAAMWKQSMAELCKIEEDDVPTHCWKDERKLRFQWAKHLSKHKQGSDPDLASQIGRLG